MGLDIFFFSQKHGSTQLQEIGYFRKVNPLVAWFSQHVEPVENCANIEVQKEQLEFLLATLDKLDPINCFELFPTIDGFFFGSTDYDDDYWESVNEVKAFISKTLQDFDFSNAKLIFHAWW